MLGWLWLHELACPILDKSCVPVGTAQFSFVMCFSHNFAAKERQEGSSSKLQDDERVHVRFGLQN